MRKVPFLPAPFSSWLGCGHVQHDVWGQSSHWAHEEKKHEPRSPILAQPHIWTPCPKI